MSEPNKHHYIPVFYLTKWAGADKKVVRYHRPEPQREVVVSRNSPKATGFELYLYRLEGGAPEAQNSIEKEFMSREVDDPAARVLEILIKGDNPNPNPDLTSEQRQAWTRFVLSLSARNPEKVKYITQQATEGLKKILSADPEEYETARGVDDPPTLLEWAEQNASEEVTNFGKRLLPKIIQHPETTNAIMRMRWQIEAIAPELPDLLTCDRPVYRYRGVMDERCFIALPISPRRLFIATRDQNTIDRVLSQGLKSLVKQLNDRLVAQADKYVYGAHDRLLSFVEKRLGRS